MRDLTALLAKAIRRGPHTADEIQDAVKAGRMQVWPGQRSVAITQIFDRPGKKVCHVLCAAGDIAELEQMEQAAAIWAKAQGCTAMTQNGRRGWRRILNKRGWRETTVTMERSL